VASYGEGDLERAKLYKLFSALFMQEPTDEMALQIKNMFKMTFDDTTYEIRMDFARLFSITAGHLPPHESLYNYPLADKPRLWGKATEEVQNFYESVGLMIYEEMDLIPDHLSAELFFMNYLIEQGLIDYQMSFFEKHLLSWVPEYCVEIKKHAQTTFYKEVAELLKEFILSDSEEFGI